jgi:hypothetical protein
MRKPASDSVRISEAIGKFNPADARKIRAVRAALRRRFPTAYELIYDNYNFFVIGYCATERPSSCIVSLAADANGVALSFYRGADVPDPHGVLEGSGKQNRFIRLRDGAEEFARPEVADAIDAAEALAPHPMRGTGRIVSILQSVSAKQRPRRKPSGATLSKDSVCEVRRRRRRAG